MEKKNIKSSISTFNSSVSVYKVLLEKSLSFHEHTFLRDDFKSMYLFIFYFMYFRELHVQGFPPLLLQTRTTRLVTCRYLLRHFLFHVSQSKPSFRRRAREREKKKQNTDEVPCLLHVIVSFILGQPDNPEAPFFPPFSFFFFLYGASDGLRASAASLRHRSPQDALRLFQRDTRQQIRRCPCGDIFAQKMLLFVSYASCQKTKGTHPFAANKHIRSYLMAR